MAAGPEPPDPPLPEYPAEFPRGDQRRLRGLVERAAQRGDRRAVLRLLGTQSGRDIDKVEASGLTPMASLEVAAPAFAEADLIVECRKIYWDDIDPTRFLDPAIDENYPDRDYHRVYFGEILAVRGTGDYRCP